MKLTDAISLLENASLPQKSQQWADLGCGDGLFTKALASILPNDSAITALDLEASNIQQIPAFFQGVSIKAEAIDFTMLPFTPGVDGILMANSLHYMRDADIFIERLVSYLKSTGSLLIVDYDREDSNQWVPYPIPIKQLAEISESQNLEMTELGRQPSQYGVEMYCAQLQKRED